jgi:hypothetical protein
MANSRLSTNPRLTSVPLASSSTILSVQSAATGTNWTTLTATACDFLRVCNATGTLLEYRRGGAGNGMHLPNGAVVDILGVSNANEISFRRNDTSNTQVTLTAEAYVI